jgi:hypothetical protein
MTIRGGGDTSPMRRAVLGAGYVTAVAAGALASFQLWLHALDVREGLPGRGLALPGTHERFIPALVLPSVAPRESQARAIVPTRAPFFSSVESGPFAGAAPFPVGPAGSPAPGRPPQTPEPPAPGVVVSPPPAPTEPGEAPSSAPQAELRTASNGSARPGRAKDGSKSRPRQRAVRAVPATPARPPTAVPAARATRAVPPAHATAARHKTQKQHAKPKQVKAEKAPKQTAGSSPPAQGGSSSAAPSVPPGHDGGGHGQGHGNGKGHGDGGGRGK